MRYLLLIAILLVAASAGADTLYTQGITDADSLWRSYMTGTAYASLFTIDETGGPFVLDSASLRLHLMKPEGATHDTIKVWIYNSYATDTSLLDTSAWKGCWDGGSDRDSTVMFVFQLNDTVYQDSSYWFVAAGKDYEGGSYPFIVIDRTTSGFSFYYKSSQTAENAIPSVMDSSSTWGQVTGASENNMIFTLYGTSTSGGDEPSSVIIWGAAKVGDACIGCE